MDLGEANTPSAPQGKLQFPAAAQGIGGRLEKGLPEDTISTRVRHWVSFLDQVDKRELVGREAPCVLSGGPGRCSLRPQQGGDWSAAREETRPHRPLQLLVITPRPALQSPDTPPQQSRCVRARTYTHTPSSLGVRARTHTHPSRLGPPASVSAGGAHESAALEEGTIGAKAWTATPSSWAFSPPATRSSTGSLSSDSKERGPSVR